MEGYLFKKGRGDSNFGRRNWKQRWFELEEDIFRYYESLDPQGKPVNLKDSINVMDAHVLPVTHHDKKNTFVLKFPKERGMGDMMLQAPDQRTMSVWIKELTAASRGETVHRPVDYPSLYDILGLDINDSPSVSDIGRAYRRAALKSHPDKGGNLAQFKEIQLAYQAIIDKIEQEEKEKLYDSFVFRVVLTKGEGDSGLGILATEDAHKRTISIKSVLAAIQVESISPSDAGELRAGDILVAVRQEDVTNMPLSRVAQKLNDLRVPPNTSVMLTFKRNFLRDGSDHFGRVEKQTSESNLASEEENEGNNDEEEEEDDDEKEPDLEGVPVHNEMQHQSVDEEEHDIDETVRVHDEHGCHIQTLNASPTSADRKSPKSPVAVSAATATAATGTNPTPIFIPLSQGSHSRSAGPSGSASDTNPIRSRSNSGAKPRTPQSRSPSDLEPTSSHLDPVTYVAALSENDELKQHLAGKDRQLEQAQSENDHLRDELIRLRNESLESEHHRKRLEHHLQHAYQVSKMSREQMAHSMTQILLVSKKVLSQSPIEVSPDVVAFLSKEALTENEIRGQPIKVAQRLALIETLSLDSLGSNIRNWSTENDSAVRRLEQLEEKLQTLGDAKGWGAPRGSRPSSSATSSSGTAAGPTNPAAARATGQSSAASSLRMNNSPPLIRRR